MIREFDLNCIQGVRGSMFCYGDNGKIQNIDIQKRLSFGGIKLTWT